MELGDLFNSKTMSNKVRNDDIVIGINKDRLNIFGISFGHKPCHFHLVGQNHRRSRNWREVRTFSMMEKCYFSRRTFNNPC